MGQIEALIIAALVLLVVALAMLANAIFKYRVAPPRESRTTETDVQKRPALPPASLSPNPASISPVQPEPAIMADAAPALARASPPPRQTAALRYFQLRVLRLIQIRHEQLRLQRLRQHYQLPLRNADGADTFNPQKTTASDPATTEDRPRDLDLVRSISLTKRGLVALPRCVVFFDTETTGVASNDRIVSLAAIKLTAADWTDEQMTIQTLHLIFNPGRKSHPEAERVHGYEDWLLRQQDAFSVRAEAIANFFGEADLLVAHNAPFDIDFYNSEMRRCGLAANTKPFFCTRDAYRRLGIGRASLSAACRHLGIRRRRRHDALEDAWLAMQVYLWLHNRPFHRDFPEGFSKPPLNLKKAPPQPKGDLSHRGFKGAVPPTGSSS